MKLFFKTTVNAQDGIDHPHRIDWGSPAETQSLLPHDRGQQYEAREMPYRHTGNLRWSTSVHTKSLAEAQTTLASRIVHTNAPIESEATEPSRTGDYKMSSELIQLQSSQDAQLSFSTNSVPITSMGLVLDTHPDRAKTTSLASNTPLHLIYSGTYETSESHLLSSDTATAPPAQRTNATATAVPPPHLSHVHDTRKVVLACVLGGVLGLVGCSIIGYCIFSLSGWYRNHKKRQPQRILSPALSPLEKMDSDDPLARLDNSIEIRRGSALYISSPLEGDNILRLKGPAPSVPPRDPRRQQAPINHDQQEFYRLQLRPEIRDPRPAPPPPVHLSHGARSNAGALDQTESRADSYKRKGPASIIRSGDSQLSHSNMPHVTSGLESGNSVHSDLQHPTRHAHSSTSTSMEASQKKSNASSNISHDGEYRTSVSSSCYSNENLVSPSTDLGLNIGRTSQSFFNNAMNMLTTESEKTVLKTTHESLQPEQRVEELSTMVDKSRTRTRHSPLHEAESSPELYDDGEGAYPVHLLKAGEDPDSFSEVNTYYANTMGTVTLENLDLFTEN